MRTGIRFAPMLAMLRISRGCRTLSFGSESSCSCIPWLQRRENVDEPEIQFMNIIVCVHKITCSIEQHSALPYVSAAVLNVVLDTYVLLIVTVIQH